MALTFEQYFDKINFGVEYETLIHDYNHLLDTELMGEDKVCSEKTDNITNNNKKNINLVNNFNKKLSSPNIFVYDQCIANSLQQNSTDKYRNWMVSTDMSVKCVQDNNNAGLIPHKKNNRKIKKCDNDLLEYVEIISPIISITNISQIYTVLQEGITQQFDFYSNSTTSNHVHMSCDVHFNNPDLLLKICSAWYYFEPVFFSLCNLSRQKNKFCRSMRSMIKAEAINTAKNLNNKSIDNIINIFQGNLYSNRTTSLNLYNLKYHGATGTIECRLKECCKDIRELQGWVYLLAVFYCRAMSTNEIKKPDEKNINEAFWKFIDEPSLELFWSLKRNKTPYFSRTNKVSSSIFEHLYLTIISKKS